MLSVAGYYNIDSTKPVSAVDTNGNLIEILAYLNSSLNVITFHLG
jgi:hypothetical protein